MDGVLRDLYFSEKAFCDFTLGYDNKNVVVCEALIDGQWRLFTESIDTDRKPLSAWEDLKYVGRTSELRYTDTREWIRKNNTLANDIRLKYEEPSNTSVILMEETSRIQFSKPNKGTNMYVIGKYHIEDNPMIGTSEELVSIVEDSLNDDVEGVNNRLEKLNKKARKYQEIYKIIPLTFDQTGKQ